ncbi:MAG: thymidine phosphorylase [Schwartzia sp.]|nr:thymidine phosphorylase [Schwartzia sp. (in: firmicutes)]
MQGEAHTFRMYDLITKKKRGGELTKEEIQYFITGCVANMIPNEQQAALLMAVWAQGMTDRETTDLTLAMAESGETMDLSSLPGVKVDKHSTGGVGDKTTLVVAPLTAAAGLTVAKMSGRGLGHTGGTIDKLESIPGFRTSLTMEEFFDGVRKNGLALMGQTGDLVPADKKLYAMRDIIAAVDSIPLIASSIMSKKLAAGTDVILLDVKMGSGAFMKTLEDAEKLAQTMVNIGEAAGKRTEALITDMNQPLGLAIGNALEVAEAAEVLRGNGPEDVREESVMLSAELLYLAGRGHRDECRRIAEETLCSGKALEKFCAMVRTQGGDDAVIRDPSKFARASVVHEVLAPWDGYIVGMAAEYIGGVSVMLGAGRDDLGDAVDPRAGILLRKKYGEQVTKGEIIATLCTSKEDVVAEAEKHFLEAISVGAETPQPRKLIYARVEKDKVVRY